MKKKEVKPDPLKNVKTFKDMEDEVEEEENKKAYYAHPKPEPMEIKPSDIEVPDIPKVDKVTEVTDDGSVVISREQLEFIGQKKSAILEYINTMHKRYEEDKIKAVDAYDQIISNFIHLEKLIKEWH